MLTDLIPLTLDKIMQSRNYTAVILSAQDKKFSIYTEAGVGKLMQLSLTDTETVRPLTHELVLMLLDGLGAKLKQVVIVDVEESVYYARLFVEQRIRDETHLVEIDARPSDCLVLALMTDIPLYCSKELLDKIQAFEVAPEPEIEKNPPFEAGEMDV